MVLENIVNHVVVLFFFCGAYFLGRFLFAGFFFAIASGMSVLAFTIYSVFLISGINLYSVCLIYLVMLLVIIVSSVICRHKMLAFYLRYVRSYFLFNKLFRLEFLIPASFLLICFIKSSFPLSDSDSLSHYSYLVKLYTSGGDFSAGNIMMHGKIPLLHTSLMTFLAYFGTFEISSIFNFYLLLLIILSLYKMSKILSVKDKTGSNSFCLIACVLLASPLLDFIVSTGRPYITIAYFCTSLLYFLLENFEKRKLDSLYIVFFALLGGALVSSNQLGLAVFGSLYIALFIAKYNSGMWNKSTQLILVSGFLTAAYALPFYLRTYFLTGDLLHVQNLSFSDNEFAGFFGIAKSLFVLSTKHNQVGNSHCLGILYLSFLPILSIAIIKKRLWEKKQYLFLLVFVILHYVVWLIKLPQARSLISTFPPYLLLLYLSIDLRKRLYKYSIYLFSGIMLAYGVFQMSRFGYGDYLFSKQTKADFVYSVISEWHHGHVTYQEENEIVNYINSNFPEYQIVFSKEVFPLTLLKNKVARLGTEKQNAKSLLLCTSSTLQKYKVIKRFNRYTLYEYI
jgi:hypothetical protein